MLNLKVKQAPHFGRQKLRGGHGVSLHCRWQYQAAMWSASAHDEQDAKVEDYPWRAYLQCAISIGILI